MYNVVPSFRAHDDASDEALDRTTCLENHP